MKYHDLLHGFVYIYAGLDFLFAFYDFMEIFQNSKSAIYEILGDKVL